MSSEESKIIEALLAKELSAEHWQIVVDATNTNAKSVYVEPDDQGVEDAN